MSNLSNDTLCIIFSFLDLKDILVCQLVNKQFHYVINNKDIWLNLCKKNYDLWYKDLKQDTWLKTYELCYIMNMLKRELKIHWLSIDEIYKLKKLELPEKQLTTLPKQISYLTNLQDMNLYQNKLSYLPKEIGKLTNLQYLGLTCNNLLAIPKEISQLVKLNYLEIYGNKLHSLPPEIRTLPHVTILTDIAIQFH